MKLHRHIPLNLLTLFTFFTLFTQTTYSQKLPSVQILQDSIKSSFRGLSVPSDSIIWVSGSNGTVGRSLDGGNTWKWMIVPGFENKDFRDIEAFDAEIAIIMAVDNPAYILKTKDGGNSWKVVFEKEQEGMFLDAMDCVNESSCICIGDPVPSKKDSTKNVFFVLQSSLNSTWDEQHDIWQGAPINIFTLPVASKNEALFAASGSNLKILNYHRKEFFFITGGHTSNLHFVRRGLRNKKINIPIMQGRHSSGAFSMCSNSKKKFYIAGGDYTEYWKDSGNVVYTTNAGKTWKRSSVHGYRSCIIQADKKTFITCGTNGVDISFNRCKSWKLIHGDGAKGKDGFNVCAKSKTGKAVYFAGTGRIGKLIIK